MNNIDIDHILSKHLNKMPLEDAEQLLLAQWIEENKEEYLRLRILLADHSEPPQNLEINTQKAWHNIQRSINAEPGNIRPLYSQKYVWMGVAASLLLAVFGLFMYASSTITIASGETQNFAVALGDGSTVTLNSHSSLEYPRFFIGKRKVRLTGEAFFSVKHDADKQFQVSAGNVLVNVLGTEFMVNERGAAPSVVVTSGLVAVKDIRSNQGIKLAGGQAATLNGSGWKNVKDENMLAWHTRKLRFDDRPLSDVLVVIGKAYDINFELEQAESSCKVTASFNNEKLEDILRQLKLILGIEYTVDGKNISISRVICR